jgi:hypothetical protein
MNGVCHNLLIKQSLWRYDGMFLLEFLLARRLFMFYKFSSGQFESISADAFACNSIEFSSLAMQAQINPVWCIYTNTPV